MIIKLQLNVREWDRDVALDYHSTETKNIYIKQLNTHETSVVQKIYIYI